MPRNYVRKTNRQNWCKEAMRSACEAVQKNEMGWLKASKTFNIPTSTLRRHALGINKVLRKNEKGMGRNSFYNPRKDSENNINRNNSTANEIAIKKGSSTDYIETEIINIKDEFLDCDGELLGISRQVEDIFAEDEDAIQYSESSEVSHQELSPSQTKKIQQSSNKDVCEFDIFGSHIAAMLKNMPLSKALYLQTKVHNLIADYRIELMNIK